MTLFTSSGRPPDLNKEEIITVARKYFNICIPNKDSIKVISSYRGRNYCFESTSSAGIDGMHVLKLCNSFHSSVSVVEACVTVISLLQARGVLFQVPVRSKTGSVVVQIPFASSEDNSKNRMIAEDIIDSTKMHSVKQGIDSVCPLDGLQYFSALMVAYVPGEVFDSIDKKYLVPDVLQEIGIKMAMMDKELKNFTNEHLEVRTNTYWNLLYFMEMRKKVCYIEDEFKVEQATTVLDLFETNVAPKLPVFEQSIIHGDVSGQNIIMERNSSTGKYHFKSFIDFEDSSKTCMVFELAICLAYIMMENLEPVTSSNCVEFVRPLIDSYTSILPLSKDELDSLYYLIMARCCQSAVNGELQFKQEPWNAYLLLTPEKSWRVINIFLEMEKDKVDSIWFS